MSIESVPRVDAQVEEVPQWQPIALPQVDPLVPAEFAEEEMTADWVPEGHREPEWWEDAEWVKVDPAADSPEAQAVAYMEEAGRLEHAADEASL